MGFLGDKLNIAEAGMVAEDVQPLLRKKGVGEDAIGSYFACLAVCDMKRFSPASADESEMKEFFRKAEAAIVRMDKEL